MKIRIEQLESRICDKERQPLDAVFFMPTGAISTDGRALLVNPYMQGFEPLPDSETIAVLSEDCDKLAKFFKKRLSKGELIDVEIDGNNAVFKCGELLTTATITIPRADRIPPDFATLLQSQTTIIEKFGAVRLCDAITAVSKSSGCDNVLIGFRDGIMEISPIDKTYNSRSLVICVK